MRCEVLLRHIFLADWTAMLLGSGADRVAFASIAHIPFNCNQRLVSFLTYLQALMDASPS